MKRCPECRRDYYDDSLSYCLDDGTALSEAEPPALLEDATERQSLSAHTAAQAHPYPEQ